MRTVYSEKIEAGRIGNGPFGSLPGERSGAFAVIGPCGMELHIVAGASADDPVLTQGWDHVSVSGKRCPNWEEMCWVKAQFWEPEECVVQYHPRREMYVSFHPTCLHLWARKEGFPEPPVHLVGPRTLNELREQKKMMGA